MRKLLLIGGILFLGLGVAAQHKDKGADSLHRARYMATHEVVKGADRNAFSFYPFDESFIITGTVEKLSDGPWLKFRTSGQVEKLYRVYARVHFRLNDLPFTLSLYQSQELLQTPAYKDYLFLPFLDATNGTETYAAGRYLDLKLDAIKDGWLTLDFNRAYNPYCAYVSGMYNCPIPPVENRLEYAITAGEKKFGKLH